MNKPKIHIYLEDGHFYPINPDTGDLVKRIPSLTPTTIWAMSRGGFRVDTANANDTFFWLSTVEARRQLSRGGYELVLTP